MDWLSVAVIPGFLELSFARRKSGAKGERSAPLTNSIPPLHQLLFVQTHKRNLLGVGMVERILFALRCCLKDEGLLITLFRASERIYLRGERVNGLKIKKVTLLATNLRMIFIFF